MAHCFESQSQEYKGKSQEDTNKTMRILGLNSLSGKASYRQISWSLEAARLDVAMVVSLWNLTGTSAAALPRYQPNFRAIGKSLNPNLAASRLHEILR